MADILFDNDIIDLLYKRIQAQELSAQEHQQLEAWGARSPEHASLIRDLGTDVLLVQAIRERYQLKKEVGWKKIKDTLEASGEMRTPVRPVAFFRRSWVRYAAAALIVLAVGIYWWERDSHGENAKQPVMAATDIGPGFSGAVLTLADGTEVVLDSAQNGVLAFQGGATAKIVNGTLVYEGGGKEIVYNTMSTPKGRQFHLTLPDGTGVWLNSASYIRYPTVFAGNERRVEVGGEAYFEVTKNSKMPFRLNINHKAEVEVLGTSFNVNAYENEESINTTLLEGIVRIKSGLPEKSGVGKTLKPGQQAQISNLPAQGQSALAADIHVVSQANIGKVMAWKNGLFNFEGASLKEVMRQVERWYDIEVVYEKDVPAREFEGEMTRGITLQQLQATLEEFGVHTRLNGRVLTVLP